MCWLLACLPCVLWCSSCSNSGETSLSFSRSFSLTSIACLHAFYSLWFPPTVPSFLILCMPTMFCVTTRTQYLPCCTVTILTKRRFFIYYFIQIQIAIMCITPQKKRKGCFGGFYSTVDRFRLAKWCINFDNVALLGLLFRLLVLITCSRASKAISLPLRTPFTFVTPFSW